MHRFYRRTGDGEKCYGPLSEISSGSLTTKPSKNQVQSYNSLVKKGYQADIHTSLLTISGRSYPHTSFVFESWAGVSKICQFVNPDGCISWASCTKAGEIEIIKLQVYSLTHPDAPQKPVATVAASSASNVRLQWNKVSGADGYIVCEKVDGTWKEIGRTTETSYRVTGLSSGTVHSFSVSAYKTVKGKEYCSPFAEKTDTIEAVTKPAAADFSLTAGEGSVKAYKQYGDAIYYAGYTAKTATPLKTAGEN